MGKGTSDQTQQGTQSQTGSQTSTTAPWAPAAPAANGLLSSVSALIPSAGGLTPAQSAGYGGVTTAATNAGNTIQGAAAPYLTSNSYNPIVNGAYQTYQNQLTPYANGSNLDPTQAPGMAQVLQTIQSDVGNSVNSQFAGAGRDLSGQNTQALARGIAQGEAQPLLNQYNTNVGNQLSSAGNLFNAGNTTANTNASLDEGALSRALTAGTASANAGLLGPTAALSGANAASSTPLTQLGSLAGILGPLAQLGGTTSATSNSTGNSAQQGTSTMSPVQQMLAYSQMFNNFGSGANNFNNVFGK